MMQLIQNKTILLYGGMLINVVLGYGVTKVNTTWLSVEAFGILSLFINLILFIRVFFSAGVFESASRLLAVEKQQENSRELRGAVLVFTLVLGILLSFFILIFSGYADLIFNIKIGFLLKAFWPFAIFLPLQNMLQVVLRGIGHISKLSIFYFLSRLFYLIMMAGLLYFGAFHLQSSIMAFLISATATVVFFSVLLQPSFKYLKKHLKQLTEEVLSYGHHLYLVNILSGVFLHVDKLLLAYFLNATQLGYYMLAYSISAPISYFSNALAASSFRQFADSRFIPKKILNTNLQYILGVVIILILFNRFIIETLFSPLFSPARPILLILTFAFAFSGLSIPYTLFFKAQKRGKEIRNITLAAQAVFLVLNIILIPLIGINGAAIALLISYALDYTLHYIVYKRLFLLAGSLKK